MQDCESAEHGAIHKTAFLHAEGFMAKVKPGDID